MWKRELPQLRRYLAKGVMAHLSRYKSALGHMVEVLGCAIAAPRRARCTFNDYLYQSIVGIKLSSPLIDFYALYKNAPRAKCHYSRSKK